MQRAPRYDLRTLCAQYLSVITRNSGQISPKGIVKGAPSPRGENLKSLKNGSGRVAETLGCPPKNKEANLKEKLQEMKEAWEIIKKGLKK